ncbi:MAG: glycine cleavage system protein GcvH [Ignavibacteriaceae bacterium]
MNFPTNIKYTKEHEWISISNNVGTIGITDYAQGELGDVVFIDIDPNIGEVKKGESIGTIEAVKTVSDIFAPVSGKVVEVNKELTNTPEAVNSDPYGLGWMVKIEIKDQDESGDLLSAEQYKELVDH